MDSPNGGTDAIDYATAFQHAPVGLMLSRQRVIVDCNLQAAEMFGTERTRLIGQSFRVLYPSPEEYERLGERIAPIINSRGHYSDSRLMRRIDGRFKGETFWCHVTGRAIDRRAPHGAGIWSFEDLGAQQPATKDLTAREREVAAQLLRGLTSKEIGRVLGISHRTVEVHRARLMKKYGTRSSVDLVRRLATG